MAHTHRTNDMVEYLLRQGSIPGMEGTEIIKREVQHGNSRFDFLLKKAEEEIYLEASRQEMPSPTGEEIAELKSRGSSGGVSSAGPGQACPTSRPGIFQDSPGGKSRAFFAHPSFLT
jgi:hypothetical protein